MTALLPLALAAFAPGSSLLQPPTIDVTTCSPSVPPGVVCLVGSVSDTAGGGPLEMGKTYLLSGVVEVPAGQVLTMQDGAVVKFQGGAELQVKGTLHAGAAILTSVHDDTVGGDTGGDGPTVGAPGDWDALYLMGGADASTLLGTELRYATTGIGLFGADATLDMVSVRDCSGAGLDLTSTSYPTVTNSSFMDNGFAIDRTPLEALASFQGNSASGNALGDFIQVTGGTLTGNLTLGPLNSLGGAPFVVCAAITVPAGRTLRFLAGTVIKFGTRTMGFCPPIADEVYIEGTLLADGLTVTSLFDDAIAGDTNKDGSLTLPAPGDWGAFVFGAGSDASVVENSAFRYGGVGTAIFPYETIRLTQADVVLDNVSVRYGAAEALDLNQNSFPTVTGCRFEENAAVPVQEVSISAVPGFTGNTAMNNVGGDYMRLGNGPDEVTGSVTIVADNALSSATESAERAGVSAVFVIAAAVTVRPSGSLTLGPGVAFKWTQGNRFLKVEGALNGSGNPLGPVVFTTLADDSVGGDTNADGGASVPEPGDWQGLTFSSGSQVVLDFVTVRYAGYAAFTNTAIFAASDATLRDSLVELSETGGLRLSAGARPSVSDCTFANNGGRAVSAVHIAAVPGFTGNAAMGNALGDYLEIVDGDAGAAVGGPGCALEIGPDNALLPDRVFVVTDDIDVPAGACLSILGGTIVKWLGVQELEVVGSLTIGGGGGTAVFTSIDDDSVGGDTRKDGATQGEPGDWDGFDLLAGGSVLDDVLLRFAGAFGPSVTLVGNGDQLTNVRVEDGERTALHLSGGALPRVDGCAFDRHRLAVDGVPLRALPGFSNNTAAGNQVGDYQRVTQGQVPFDLLVSRSQAVNNGPIVVATNVSVLLGTTLTLDPGVILKFEGNRLVDVDGILLSFATLGTTILTTLTDDIAGDTNKDGGATVPVPGAWQGISFDPTSDGSVLGGARVRYAGAGGAALRANAILLTVVDTLVEFFGSGGLSIAFSARPQVRRTSFQGGVGLPVPFAPLQAVSAFDQNLASGNAAGDYIRVTSASLSGPATVRRHNALNGNGVFVLATDVNLPTAGSSLDLCRGVIVKWEGSRSVTVGGGTLAVHGTGLEPVILTSLDDDAFGGDTRKDGSSTLPAPGDWRSLSLGNSGAPQPSSIEHLRVRYGGAASAAAIVLSSPLGSARSIRSDFSASDGIQAAAHVGDAVNWVAFASAGHGIDLTGGAFDLVHATVAASNGVGVNRSFPHVGQVWNANLFGNAAGEAAGFMPGEVHASNAGASFAGFDGNIDSDPLFVDLASGALGLRAGSPCIDAADAAAGLAAVEDHVEASRVLDDGFDGTVLPDMGAYERAAYALAFGGEPRVGTQMVFTASGGPAGLAVFVLGFLNGSTFHDPFGFTMYGIRGSGSVLGVAPTGEPIEVRIPPEGGLPGAEFAVQALARPFQGPTGPPADVDPLRSGPVPIPIGTYEKRATGALARSRRRVLSWGEPLGRRRAGARIPGHRHSLSCRRPAPHLGGTTRTCIAGSSCREAARIRCSSRAPRGGSAPSRLALSAGGGHHAAGRARPSRGAKSARPKLMVRCPSSLELERYQAGDGTRDERAAIERHGAQCPTCRSWLADAAADESVLPALCRALAADGEPGATPEVPAAPGSTSAPTALARYRILGRLGGGGMGIVYEAEQESPRRRVALKVPRSGPLDEESARRFRYEAELLGRLDHPGIARIIEAGTFETGDGSRPFFALELVEGLPLDEFARGLSVRAKLELFVAIGRAVQHAHQKGVVHRDLKPDNVLVMPGARPKVLDFGVARGLGEGKDRAGLTRAGQVLGTLAYMSPEQMSGDVDAIDARADVYALGVMLFELLAGVPPLDFSGASLGQAVPRILGEAPRRLGEASPALAGDLETICATALRKDPERRYDSASALVADVERFLGHEPIAARPASRAYLFSKFVRRHRVAVGAAALLVLALAAGLTGTSLQARRARAAEGTALTSEARARAALAFLSGLFLPDATPVIGAIPVDRRVVEALDDAAARLATMPPGDPAVEAVVRMIVGKAYLGLARLEDAELHLERARELREAEGRGPTGDLNEIVSALVSLASMRGDAERAGALVEQQLEMSRALYGAESAEVSTALVNLASIRGSAGDYVAAEDACREALDLKRRLLGERDPGVANVLAHLAFLRIRQGDADEAIALTEEALQIFRAALGDGHELVAACRTNLSSLLAKRGELDAALEHARAALEVATRLVEEDHPTRLDARRSVGELLVRRGDFAGARRELEAVVAGERARSERAWPLSLALLGLARAEAGQDEVPRAVAHLEEAARVRRELLGDEHDSVREIEAELRALSRAEEPPE